MMQLCALWEQIKLDQVNLPDYPICYGVLKPGVSDPDGIPMLRVKDISHNQLDLSDVLKIGKQLHREFIRSKLGGSEILISVQGTVGRVALADKSVEGFNISRTIAKITTSNAVSRKFIRYYLLSPSGVSSINEHSGGTTRASLNIGDLRNIIIPLPAFYEQKVIADKLDTLLAQVETTKARLERIPEILKRFRQSVLAAAVSGRLTEEWRLNNPKITTYTMLENHTPLPKPARWNSRADSYIEGTYATAVGLPSKSPIAEWAWTPLVDIARMESGHTPSRSKPEYWGGDVCWIGIKDANRNHTKTILDTEQKTNQLGLANSASRLLPAGTVCVSRTASVGYVVKMGKPMATSQDFVNWVPTSVLNPDWLKWLFVAEKESLYRFGKGSTHHCCPITQQ